MSVRCGLVGLGHWASSALVPALREQSDVELVGCVGASLHEAQSFSAREWAGVACGSLDEMLDKLRPDFVVVATPDHVHASATRSVLGAGAAVYCEKPLANDLATASQLADLADHTGLAATVGYSFRFNPAIQALRRDIADGRLGQPWLIELAEHNPQFHPHSGKAMNWKGDPEQASGGALFEYGSHILDLASWLLGPIRRVSSSLQRVLPGARLDDIATLQMEFTSGAGGTLLASWVLNGGFPGIHIRLHGSEALAELWLDDRLPGGQRYVLSSAFGPGAVEQGVTPMRDFRTDATRRHIADFVSVLGGGSPQHEDTLPTLRQGAATQAVLEAALRATQAWQDVSPV